MPLLRREPWTRQGCCGELDATPGIRERPRPTTDLGPATVLRRDPRIPGSAQIADSLLVAYCQAVAQHDRAVQAIRTHGDVVNGKASPWIVVQEEAVRAMTALSMRLRLSPQARREKAQLPRPTMWWEQQQQRRTDDE